jgi:hypothetical protein
MLAGHLPTPTIVTAMAGRIDAADLLASIGSGKETAVGGLSRVVWSVDLIECGARATAFERGDRRAVTPVFVLPAAHAGRRRARARTHASHRGDSKRSSRHALLERHLACVLALALFRMGLAGGYSCRLSSRDLMSSGNRSASPVPVGDGIRPLHCAPYPAHAVCR